MRIREYLNREWYFTTKYTDQLLEGGINEAVLERVDLPHSCVETPFHYFDEHIYQMVSGYKKMVRIPEEWKGKVLLLTIDGAAHQAQVYLNGELIGEHNCGYTAFTLDITNKVKYGEENELVVRVDSRENLNIPPFGFVVDYMTYGGIYRDVYIDVLNMTYLSDVFVHGNVTDVTKKKVVSTSEISWEGELEKGSIRQYIRKKGEEDYQLLTEAAVTGGSSIKMNSYPTGIELWDT